MENQQEDLSNGDNDEEFKKVLYKMKIFCNSIHENFSNAISKYKNILDKKYSTKETIFPILKMVGGNLSKAITDGLSVASNKQDRNFGKCLFDFIVDYQQNVEHYQKILIEAGITIFIAYEFQFNNCYDGVYGEARALDKIAYDIVMKILNGLNKNTQVLSVAMILKCIVESEVRNVTQPVNNVLENTQEENRTITYVYKNKHSKSKTIQIGINDIFIKPGIRVKENNKYLFYTPENSDPSKYGYRNSFEGELVTDRMSEGIHFNYTYKLNAVNIKEFVNDYYFKFTQNSPIHIQKATHNDIKEIKDKIDKVIQSQDSGNIPSKSDDTENEPYAFGIEEHVFNFIGREKYLKNIDECFDQHKRKIAVVGMPGIGKTELLRKYTSDSDNKYQNLIWFNADNEEDLKKSFSAIANKFKILNYTCEVDVSRMLREIFIKLNKICTSTETKTLLIYDNVEDKLMINNYLPLTNELKTGLIHILITSRNRESCPLYDDIIELENMSDDESRKLIYETIKNEDNLPDIFEKYENFVCQVIEINAGLPLALQQAIAYIVEEGRNGQSNPFEVYITNYKTVLDASYDKHTYPDYSLNKYPNTIYVTYKLILEKLRTNKKAVTLMQICSFLDPNGVSKAILCKFPGQEEVQRSIRALEKYSLMKCMEDFVIVHRLVSEITRILYLKEKSDYVFSKVLEFNLRFNYLIQLNSITLATSERFFPFLLSVNSMVIFQYVDDNIEEVQTFFKKLSASERDRLFILLVYHGCTKTVKSIIKEKEEKFSVKDLIQTCEIGKLCSEMKNVTESFTKQDERTLELLIKKKYAGCPLNIACIAGHEEISKFLIDKKAHLTNTKISMYPLSHIVVQWGYDQIFKYLVAGALSDKDEHGSTLLHVASSAGRNDIIEDLLARNMKLNDQNHYGDTILHSCFYNQIYPQEQLKYLFTPITRENLLKGSFVKNDISTYFQVITKHSSISTLTEETGFAHGNMEWVSNYFKYLRNKSHNGYSIIIDTFGKDKELNIRNKYGIYPSHLHVLSNYNLNEDMIAMAGVDEFGNDPLKYACANNNWNAVKLLIQNEKYLSNKNKFGFSILHSAACSGNIEMFKFIKNHSKTILDINETDNNGCSVLHVALINKHYELAKFLIDYGSDVNLTFDGISALHLSAAAGQLEIVQKLLDENAKLDQRDDFGLTALHYFIAANGGQPERKFAKAAEYSDSSNFEVTKKRQIINCTNNVISFAVRHFIRQGMREKFNNVNVSPLSNVRTVTEEQIKIIKLLVHYVDINIVDNKNNTFLHYACYYGCSDIVLTLIERGANINQRNKDEVTALHFAACAGHLTTVELLLENCADIHACTSNGTTALHFASQKGHSDKVLKLIERGADVNQQNKDENTALHLAAYAGPLTTVELLLENRADIHAYSSNVTTALQFASQERHSDIALKLIERGADINQRTKDEETALHFAAFYGHLTTVELLLEYCANIHAYTRDGTTALHLASQKGHSDIVLKLIKNGSKINEGDVNGRTALHMAALGGHLATVEMLLKIGANQHACTSDGKTALHLALQAGHLNIVSILGPKHM